ncbi:hypothetical protein COU78_04105 [Candidatus Peregrinibacteria bacterium CG10_big_fil_rev_8_21_14_0_10_49_24]|nr:MAG: hypothetical protein COV83_00635 [Candidatus Peregrinibacteria bacterium CG11_big_fil_rev_8_21_14_0_20_49_14]PIR50852.1 MAG: hypothetical protein COU78_04105 [Candidatus Peregrinibacteria bacterium CG10_big_fil_rev_8_21_14_0_10_49_24]PJA67129.1 MAG: hypothetical protein CO157_06035 [Candidatus Peregrinibacteria bacterium CG_4_9_14_3_um_filter_49_12]
MENSCSQCSASFEISDEDLKLLEKISPVIGGKTYALPPPTMCFQCRLQRRLAFYNSRSLYRRKCDLTKKKIVSIYSPDKPFTVYERKTWYGDGWDPLEYGREFDFNRPFFEQMHELMETVPMLSLAVLSDNVNSEFTNDNLALKNSYLIFDGERSEDCMYGHTFAGIKSCLDFTSIVDCELCYECVHCNRCYNCTYVRFSINCSDSWFLRDCIGCKNCFGCANLRQKQYCVFNEQKTKEEYEAFLRQFETSSHAAVQEMKKKADAFFLAHPVKAVRGEQNINVTGDNIYQSKDTSHCFDCYRMQDCRYCTNCLVGAKDCCDVHIWGDNMELSYNCCVAGVRVRNLIGCYYVSEGCDNISYSIYCSRQCSNLFGCIGLRHKSNCIFNTQYSKEEYQKLAARIMVHMQRTGEWGEFFPPALSAFGYNETMAQTFFPLEKKEVQNKGWQWSDYEMPLAAEKTIPATQLPDNANDIPEDVLSWAILCEETGKPFKIVKKELEFYREHRLPLPRRHPDRRHADRFAYKNPYRLWQRTCAKTGEEILSSYAPERPEIVFAEEAYKQEVY